MSSKTRLPLIVSLIILFSGISSAQTADFNIRDTCQDREEPLFSLYDREGGNIGEPGHFKWQVCGSGVEEVEIQESCESDMNSILSMYQRNDSHASTYQNYRLQVCASFTASINNSCQPENRIVSLAKQDNSHVAEPGEFSYQLCGSPQKVETVTLEMTLDSEGQIYSDGQPVSEGYYTEDAEFPYIVTDQPAGIVSYGSWNSINYTSQGSKDVLRVEQSEGGFLIPNTKEDYTAIESREDLVENQNFLQQVSPSFGFPQPEDPTVRVILDPEVKVDGFNRSLQGSISLYARHRADSDPEAVIDLGTS
ncbi:MAG: hypothetical protein ACI8Z7_000099 [Candidatus Nanohaloarchaea archaeon]|jgi:hypothetical protein